MLHVWYKPEICYPSRLSYIVHCNSTLWRDVAYQDSSVYQLLFLTHKYSPSKARAWTDLCQICQE